MTAKSIIEIDIRDQAFKNFAALYSQYDAKLKQAPKAWQTINSSIDGSTKNFKEMVAQEVAAIGKAKLMEQVQAKALELTKAQVSQWRMIEKATQQVASNTTRIAGNIIRAASMFGDVIGGIGIGGLLGGGGLMLGMDRLAGSVTASRSQAIGSGVSYGERRSFQTNFGRILSNPDQFLGNVSTTLDSADRSAFAQGGLRNPSDLQGGTSAVALRLLQSLKGKIDSNNGRIPLESLWHVTGAEKSMDFSSFQTLARTKQSELSGLIGNFAPDAKAMNLGDTQQKAWADLNRQLEAAGNTISRVFIKGISPLAPAFDTLSKSVTATVAKFFSDNKGSIETGMTELADGIRYFAGYITTPEFQNGIKNFATDILKIGQAIGRVASWIPDSSTVSSTVGTLAGGTAKGGDGKDHSAEWLYGIYGAAKMKADAGYLSPELSKAAADLQHNISGIGIVTSGNDYFHRIENPNSAHSINRAFDIEGGRDQIAATLAELHKMGYKNATVDFEAKNTTTTDPRKYSTNDHLHIDLRVLQNPSSDITASASIAPGPGH